MVTILLTTVSASSIGTFQANEEMQITNYCEAGVCTFINLTSLEYPNGTIVYPNAAMSKNGQAYNYSFTPVDLGTYTFVSCGDSTIAICDKDTFYVNFNGEENSIGTMIILLLFFIGLFMGYFYLNGKVNYDKWYEGILKKYEDKNYVKVVFSVVGYNLIRSKATNYYLLGFPIILLVTDIVMSYNINSLFALFEYVMFIYSLGIFMVAFLLFGQWQEFIVKAIGDINDMTWGLGSE